MNLKQLATFATVAEAEMIRELLKQNGIESTITGEADPIGATSGAVPIELLVDEKDFDRASEIFSPEPRPSSES